MPVFRFTLYGQIDVEALTIEEARKKIDTLYGPPHAFTHYVKEHGVFLLVTPGQFIEEIKQ